MPIYGKCTRCTRPAFIRDGSRECCKCKDRLCGSCEAITPDTNCDLCDSYYCVKCYETHNISFCDDCNEPMCFNTYKQHQTKHICCSDCKKYCCQKLPQLWLKKHLPPQYSFLWRCSPCILKYIRCKYCVQTCTTVPYECSTCHIPICFGCKSRGMYIASVGRCQRCDNHHYQMQTKHFETEFTKTKKAYILLQYQKTQPLLYKYIKHFMFLS